jgi:chromosome segregation ATPase
LLSYIRDDFLTQKSQEHLEKIIRLKAEIVTIDRELKALEHEKKNILNHQTRLRDNLGRLGHGDDKEKRLRNRYVEQLNRQEDRLAEMESQVKQLLTKRLRLQKQLDEMIENLTQDLTL